MRRILIILVLILPAIALALPDDAALRDAFKGKQTFAEEVEV